LFAGAAHEGHGNALWAYRPRSAGQATAARETGRGYVSPAIERRGDRALMPVVFPHGTSAVLSHAATLGFAETDVQPDAPEHSTRR
jgi:hypothetical protein